MKRVIILLLSTLLALSSAIPAFAAETNYPCYKEVPEVVDFGAFANLPATYTNQDNVHYYIYIWDHTQLSSYFETIPEEYNNAEHYTKNTFEAKLKEYYNTFTSNGFAMYDGTINMDPSLDCDSLIMFIRSDWSIGCAIQGASFIIVCTKASSTDGSPSATESTAPSQNVTPGLINFKKSRDYSDGLFTDVKSTDWFAGSVKSAYELGLMNGNGSGFNPGGNITFAETIALASRMHSIYTTGKAEFVQGTPWYQVYVDHAIKHGIIHAGDYSNYSATATRAQFVTIMYNAIPSAYEKEINNITRIPDVPDSAQYASKVLAFYKAGILTGNDAYGTFNPNSNIQRSEIAAIVTRIAILTERKDFTLQSKPIAVDSIAIQASKKSINIGETLKLGVTFAPSGATDGAVTWSSSNTAVATVDKDGNVKGTGAGSTVITAVSSNKKRSTLTLTVTKVPPVSEPVPSDLSPNLPGLFIASKSNNTVKISWNAVNNSGKTINYYTVRCRFYDQVGGLVKDDYTNKDYIDIKIVGPVEPREKLKLFSNVCTSKICARVTLESIILEYSDGTKETVNYGYTTKKLKGGTYTDW